jgi:hypothetical protein
MSTGNLNIWVGEVGEPCRIVGRIPKGQKQPKEWFAHILHCDGDILTWCGKAYTNLPTQCGHLEVDVPPGCYVVCATWSEGTGATFLGNHLTHCAVVQVKCGDHACITLFNPTLHSCGSWFLLGLRGAIRFGGLDRETVQLAEAAAQAVERLLPRVPGGAFAEKTARLGVQERPK